MIFSIPAWIAMHTMYVLTTTPDKPLLLINKEIKNEFREAGLYMLMCIALFSYSQIMTTAVVMSCVIASIYVFCVMILRVLVFFMSSKRYGLAVLIANNIFIATTLCYLLYLDCV